MWRDYSSWVGDVEDRRTSALTDLETRFKMGRGISPEAYTAGRQRINVEADAELADLRAGPTYQMLRENYEASTRAPTPRSAAGAGMDRPWGDIGAPALPQAAEQRPAPSPTPVAAAPSMEEFYGGHIMRRAGGEVAAGGPSPKRGPRPGGQADNVGLLEREKRAWFYV